ncbi:MAG: transposase [Bacteroidales bacterium]|jgi:transposase|nr:transposase [Bacteroidales bacterium]
MTVSVQLVRNRYSDGFTIGYEIFEGNIFEGHTFIPVLQNMSNRFSFGKPVVIADAGLLSDSNITALEKDGYEYILGARPKNAKGNIKPELRHIYPVYDCNSLVNKSM